MGECPPHPRKGRRELGLLAVPHSVAEGDQQTCSPALQPEHAEPPPQWVANKRPSGHDISTKFARDNGASIPPNLIAVAHTESNAYYQRYCKERGIKPHPARFPAELPEYFVRMLTDEGDMVLDPFGGSCVTGEVCERLGRRWVCVEIVEEYLDGAKGRFVRPPTPRTPKDPDLADNYYRVPRPDILWDGLPTEPLAADGGRKRPTVAKTGQRRPAPPARRSPQLRLADD